MLPPTVLIKEDWWETTQRQILTNKAAGTALLMLGAKEKAVPNKVEAKERHILATITLATLKIIYLLLKAPLRSPLEAYIPGRLTDAHHPSH